MSPLNTIRALARGDRPALESILDRINLVPRDMLASMAAPFLDGHAPHCWLVADDGERPVGFALCGAHRMTQGCLNLRAIGVDPTAQRQGVGIALVQALQHRLRATGGSILIVETSSGESFANTRSFYRRQRCVEEARIRDFWAAGDDEVTFWKQL